MGGNNVKKDDENGQLSCGIYSSPAAACLLLQRLGQRSLPRSLDMYYGIHGLERVGCVHLTYIHIGEYIPRERPPRPPGGPPLAALLLKKIYKKLGAPSAPQMFIRLPLCHEGSEYVLSFEIGQREDGFYSGRTDTLCSGL